MANGGIPIDMSGSNVEIQDTDSMRVRNLIVPGYPGKYWVDFTWDPNSLVFIPVNLGKEAATQGKYCSKVFSAGNDSLFVEIGTDPVNRLIYFAVTGYGGTPSFYYYYIDVFQGNKQFDVDTSQYWVDGDTALITGDSGWDVTESIIYTGVTKTGYVSNIPSWFDFSMPFTVGYSGLTFICN